MIEIQTRESGVTVEPWVAEEFRQDQVLTPDKHTALMVQDGHGNRYAVIEERTMKAFLTHRKGVPCPIKS